MTAGPETSPSALERVVSVGLERTGIPGAEALVLRDGRVVDHVARGWAATHDAQGPLAEPRPLREGTLFDIASLTKVVATTAVATVLADRGQLDIDERAGRHLPDLRGDAEAITVADLLEHRSGLPTWYPLFLDTDDPAEAVALACRQPLTARPGAARCYSDLGMLVLGAALERIADEPLDTLAARHVFEPLGMTATGYLPGTAARARAAATSTGNPAERALVAALDPPLPSRAPAGAWRNHTLVGECNDANAAVAMRGVAGHAGVFSTARDLARFGEALRSGGVLGGQRIWSAATVARVVRPGRDDEQGLGVWRRRASSALGTDLPDDDSVGHRGFTGCELAASPAGGWVAVLLTNRLHATADPPPAHEPLWREVVRFALSTTGCS